MPDSYRPNIVSTALSDPLRVIARKGGTPERILHLAGFSDAGSSETICLRSFVRFSELAANELRAPSFGWEVGQEFDLHNLGAVGEYLLEAPTLGCGLRLFTRTFAMVQSDSALELTVNGLEAILSYRILDLSIWPRQQDVELTLGVLLRALRHVAGANWQPNLITFEHDTSPIWKDPQSAPRCKVEYQASQNAIHFPASLLDLPMKPEEKDRFVALSSALAQESRKIEREAPVTVLVRREIIKRFGQDSLDQTEISGALGFSRRTLRRRLESENHSFSSILSACRIQQAEHLLTSTATPLVAIAEHLGYSDVVPFERAFRSVMGITPAQYRKQS